MGERIQKTEKDLYSIYKNWKLKIIKKSIYVVFWKFLKKVKNYFLALFLQKKSYYDKIFGIII